MRRVGHREALRAAVRGLREQRGWNQAQLAARLQISSQCLNAYECGRRQIGMQMARRMATTFGLRLSSLLARAEQIEGGDDGI